MCLAITIIQPSLPERPVPTRRNCRRHSLHELLLLFTLAVVHQAKVEHIARQTRTTDHRKVADRLPEWHNILKSNSQSHLERTLQ